MVSNQVPSDASPITPLSINSLLSARMHCAVIDSCGKKSTLYMDSHPHRGAFNMDPCRLQTQKTIASTCSLVVPCKPFYPHKERKPNMGKKIGEFALHSCFEPSIGRVVYVFGEWVVGLEFNVDFLAFAFVKKLACGSEHVCVAACA